MSRTGDRFICSHKNLAAKNVHDIIKMGWGVEKLHLLHIRLLSKALLKIIQTDGAHLYTFQGVAISSCK